MDVLRPLFDDLAKETLIINEASQPFPPARERLFLPLFFHTMLHHFMCLVLGGKRLLRFPLFCSAS